MTLFLYKESPPHIKYEETQIHGTSNAMKAKDGKWCLNENEKGVCQAVESVPLEQPCVVKQVYILLWMLLCTKHNMPLVCIAFA